MTVARKGQPKGVRKVEGIFGYTVHQPMAPQAAKGNYSIQLSRKAEWRGGGIKTFSVSVRRRAQTVFFPKAQRPFF